MANKTGHPGFFIFSRRYDREGKLESYPPPVDVDKHTLLFLFARNTFTLMKREEYNADLGHFSFFFIFCIPPEDTFDA